MQTQEKLDGADQCAYVRADVRCHRKTYFGSTMCAGDR